MSSHDKPGGDDEFPHVPLLHGPQTDEERASETHKKAEHEEKKSRDARDERLVKATEAQANTASQQHTTNVRIAVFTFLLVIVSGIGNLIAWRAASAANKAANTASKALTSSDESAAKTLSEMHSQSTAMSNAATAQQQTAERLKDQISRLDIARAASDQQAKAALEASIKQSASALEQSESALEAQTRPWIDMEPLDISSFIPGDIPVGSNSIREPIASFTLKLTNFGQSPAILTGKPAFAVTFLNGKPETRIWTPLHHADLCREYERFPGAPPDSLAPRFGYPIRQGSSDTRIIHPSVDSMAQPRPESLRNFLYGCIGYLSPTGHFYETRVVYVIEYAEDATTMLGRKYHAIKRVTRSDYDFGPG
ncbi:MAG TPA: hypothetical protein VHZ74_14860 [Bryobacteraceae bacterium]|jgi:hypothetical protein|nr:hypothetical protein [Bryobacteraceae bacterium]